MPHTIGKGLTAAKFVFSRARIGAYVLCASAFVAVAPPSFADDFSDAEALRSLKQHQEEAFSQFMSSPEGQKVDRSRVEERMRRDEERYQLHEERYQRLMQRLEALKREQDARNKAFEDRSRATAPLGERSYSLGGNESMRIVCQDNAFTAFYGQGAVWSLGYQNSRVEAGTLFVTGARGLTSRIVNRPIADALYAACTKPSPEDRAVAARSLADKLVRE